MRGGGVGGPLLSIGDLFSDVGDEDSTTSTDEIIHNSHRHSSAEDASLANQQHMQPSDLTKLYQESYKRLNDAISSTSHSWTTLTLELCLALETANKLIQSSDLYALEALEKIQELERIMNKGNSVIKEAEFIRGSGSHEESLDS